MTGWRLGSFGRAMVLAGVATAAVAVASPPAHAACTRDSECKGVRICENGRCVTPPQGNEAQGSTAGRPAESPAPAQPAQPGGPMPAAAPAFSPPPPRTTGVSAEPAPTATSPVWATSPTPGAIVPSAGGDDTVPVEISGPEGYVIRATNRSGTTVECVSPCVLRLSPGQAHVHVVGYFDRILQVPNHPASARFSLRRTGWIVTGAILGTAGLIHSIVLYASGGRNSREWIPAPAILGAAGFGIMIGELAGSHSTIEIEGAQLGTSASPGLAFGLLPQRNGGLFVTGMRF